MPSPRLNIGRLLLNKVEFVLIYQMDYEELLIISKRSKKQVNIFLESIPFSPETKEVLVKINKKKYGRPFCLVERTMNYFST